MTKSQRSLLNYPLFQIPLMLFLACLIIAALFWLLGFGRPQVAVAIALDISGSTYDNNEQLFNQPGTVMAQEVSAVEAYLDQNSADILRQPNQVQIFGFGGVVKPLTSRFESNSEQVQNELTQALRSPNLAQQVVPGATNIDRAIQEGTNALATVEDRCRELIVVTDGEGIVTPEALASAIAERVTINAVVIGAEAIELRGAALATGGRYISQGNNLESLFTERFFRGFNSNFRWLIFWIGCAWIALMWLLVMPLDRWIFQGLFKLHWSASGRMAIANAIFWTVLTPFIIWRLAGGLPFISSC